MRGSRSAAVRGPPARTGGKSRCSLCLRLGAHNKGDSWTSKLQVAGGLQGLLVWRRVLFPALGRYPAVADGSSSAPHRLLCALMLSDAGHTAVKMGKTDTACDFPFQRHPQPWQLNYLEHRKPVPDVFLRRGQKLRFLKCLWTLSPRKCPISSSAPMLTCLRLHLG